LLKNPKFKGMILPDDNEFLFVAKEGLKTALPPGWKPC